MQSGVGTGPGSVWKRNFYVRLDANTDISVGIVANDSDFADHLDNPDNLYRQRL